MWPKIDMRAYRREHLWRVEETDEFTILIDNAYRTAWRDSQSNPNWKKQQRGDATKTPEAGRNRRPKGHFFSSRPVTW